MWILVEKKLTVKVRLRFGLGFWWGVVVMEFGFIFFSFSVVWILERENSE